MGIIYQTVNLVNNKKYIGKQWNTLNKKYLGSGKALKLAIKKYGIQNFRKDVLEDLIDDFTTLSEKEIYYINLYDAVHSKEFYNIASGGTGGKTVEKQIWTKESRKKASESAIIRNKNPEYLKKLSIAHIGKKLSEEHKLKLSLSHKNQNNLNLSKKVCQYDLNGKLINVYPSLSEACRQLGKSENCAGSISKCCKNNKYTYLGYKWGF